ncbi:MAG: DNA/RNA nuclease SfsA [Clostridiaceae bacterium]|nr:DNA/RNA nuclease SfsA [Clostridiaceae bacterium]
MRVKPIDNIAIAFKNPRGKIILATAKDSKEYAPDFSEPSSYRLFVKDSIIVCGIDERGVAQGCYYIEDLMNINEGPVISMQDISRKPLFLPRMVHSGYGLDMYPDAHIKTIAHLGMDAILIFVKDVDRTPNGYVDFNELIYRAAGFGVDVYAYSYFISKKHPDAPDAIAHYESTYGRLFASCPGLKGIVLVGESMEFPSKDTHTTGRPYYESTIENNPTGKPSPGWYPCYDYSDLVNMIKTIVRSKNPQADIVFWTYNWGYVDEEPRLELIRKLPTDISLLVTYEMFEQFKVSETVTRTCVDYTLSFEGPGKYFVSEAEEAKRCGIRLYTMCNTGGRTWDIGVIPYQPAPYQWKRRYDGLLDAHNKWSLSGLMESHHYGFYPSIVSELAKWSYWTPTIEYDQVINLLAARDFGVDNIEPVLDAFRYYSDGIRSYVSTNEVQYGPFRIGPAYPLLYKKTVEIPSPFHAMFGNNKICMPMYTYDIKDIDKLNYEIDSLDKMEKLYDEGNSILEEVISTLCGMKLDEALRLLNLGKFIVNCVQTTINVKKWHILKCELEKSNNAYEMAKKIRKSIIHQMIELAQKEIENAENSKPLVEFDSRLGFEPSMEYMCDKFHLEWKIDVTCRTLNEEIIPLLDIE